MKPLQVNYNYDIIDNLIKFVSRPIIQPEILITVKVNNNNNNNNNNSNSNYNNNNNNNNNQIL